MNSLCSVNSEYQIDSLAEKVELREDGIWYALDSRNIAYPSEGNDRSLILEENSFWFRHRNKCIVSTVNKFHESGPFYDIGGGNGYVSMGLQNAGIDTILVEPGSGVQNAKKRGVKYIVGASFQDAGFLPNHASGAGIFDVLEHIEDEDSFLTEVCSLLRSDGHLYVTVPAYNFLWSGEDVSAGHYRRYTLKSLEHVLRKNGYELVYSSYIFSFLPLPIFFFRTIPSLLGKRKEIKIDTHQNEHKERKSIMGNVLERILEKEFSYISKCKKIPFGGSCFAVAKKLSSVQR